MTGIVIEQEPTPEMETACRDILNAWLEGQLPFPEAVERMVYLSEEAENSRHIANQARVEYLLGYMRGTQGNIEWAIKHYNKARDLFEEIQNWPRVNRCDLNLAETYRLGGSFRKSLDLFGQVYKNAQEIGEIRTQTIALANSGQVLYSTNQLEQAKDALLRSYELTHQWSDNDMRTLSGLLCEVHHTLAMIYLHEEDTTAAWKHAKKAFSEAQVDGRPLEIGQANRTIGEILTELGEVPENDQDTFTDDLDEYFQRAYNAFKEIDAEGEMGRTLYEHARSLHKRGRRIPAARKLQPAVLIFAKLGMIDDSDKAAKLQQAVF